MNAIIDYAAVFSIASAVLAAACASHAPDASSSGSVVRVSVTSPGSSAENVQRQIAQPITKRAASLQGLTDVSSASTYSKVIITLRFDPKLDKKKAIEEVRRAVEAVKSDLPENAEPTVSYDNDGAKS